MKTADLEKLFERARAISARLLLQQDERKAWLVGVYFFDGRRYEWAADTDFYKAFTKAIEFTEREVRASDDFSDLA